MSNGPFGVPPGGGWNQSSPGAPGPGGGFGPLPGAPGGFGTPPGPPPPAAPSRPKKSRTGLILLVVGLPLGLCCVSGIGLLGWAGFETSKYSGLENACEGRGVSGAASRRPGAPPRVAGYARSGSVWSLRQGFVPRPRQSSGLDDTEVVACVDREHDVEVERCAYEAGGGTNVIERRRYQRSVQLVEARTGQVLASVMLQGSPPAECNEWEAFAGGGTTSTRHGGTLTDSAIQAEVLGLLGRL